MVKSFNDEVLEKIDDIISYIKSSDNYKKFKSIEEKMENNSVIMDKINSVKNFQKEIVKLEVEKKDVTFLEKEIEKILLELDSYPIYQEYNYLLHDLNDTFQSIRIIIEKYLNEKINWCKVNLFFLIAIYLRDIIIL